MLSDLFKYKVSFLKNLLTFTVCIFLCFIVLLLYVVPAFMYCLYNNLAFVNLANYDPTTYYLLLQFRVVVTGVIFQVRVDNLAKS